MFDALKCGARKERITQRSGTFLLVASVSASVPDEQHELRMTSCDFWVCFIVLVPISQVI
jgi:hypothetical protein